MILGQNLLSIFAPVAVMICSKPSLYKKPELRSSAALALAKFMLVRCESFSFWNFFKGVESLIFISYFSCQILTA